jgi:hypothetical protein
MQQCKQLEFTTLKDGRSMERSIQVNTTRNVTNVSQLSPVTPAKGIIFLNELKLNVICKD